MSSHNPITAIRHMLDHTREAVSLAASKTRADLDSDRLLNLALVRLLEIVGEAAGRVPKEYCRLHPEIPWPQLISLRNRLIHGYDSVDFDILWQIVVSDLPSLIPLLERMISTEEKE